MANLSAEDFLRPKYRGKRVIRITVHDLAKMLEEFHELKKEEAIKNLSERVKKSPLPPSDTITT